MMLGQASAVACMLCMLRAASKAHTGIHLLKGKERKGMWSPHRHCLGGMAGWLTVQVLPGQHDSVVHVVLGAQLSKYPSIPLVAPFVCCVCKGGSY